MKIRCSLGGSEVKSGLINQIIVDGIREESWKGGMLSYNHKTWVAPMNNKTTMNVAGVDGGKNDD